MLKFFGMPEKWKAICSPLREDDQLMKPDRVFEAFLSVKGFGAYKAKSAHLFWSWQLKHANTEELYHMRIIPMAKGPREAFGCAC